jgi:diaminopimelate epimerase
MDMASDFLQSKRPGREGAKLSRVTFVSPGGNDTAIVWDQMNRKLYGIVSKYIQEAYGNIEQVMFAEKDPKTGMYRGQMAGGEYCGNATRSFGYMLLNGQNGEIEVEVSGAIQKQKVTVLDGQSATQIPLGYQGALGDKDTIQLAQNGEYIVKMGGIAHLASYQFQKTFQLLSKTFNPERRKDIIRGIIGGGALADFPAAGVMLVTRTERGDFILDPYVYVAETQTIYNETACGSGTAAVAMVEAFRRNQSIPSIKVLQPSGMNIEAKVGYRNKKFENVCISGGVEVLYDGEIVLQGLSDNQEYNSNVNRWRKYAENTHTL